MDTFGISSQTALENPRDFHEVKPYIRTVYEPKKAVKLTMSKIMGLLEGEGVYFVVLRSGKINEGIN